MDAGKRGEHRHKWCAGWHLPLHHPALCFGYPQVLLWGLPVRNLQQQHLRCGHRFLWGVKRTPIPPNPSAAFPEAEEFSLNPKEKYLYMRFYDLKSVHETDLSLHFPEESWLKRCCFQILCSMVGFYTCKEMNEALQLVLKSDTTQWKKDLHCLCNSHPSPVLFMLHQQIIQASPQANARIWWIYWTALSLFRIMLSTLWSSLHPKNVSSSISNTAD